ncbi:MAG: caspase family protein [Treponema sp.]|nr:caspase family protein [Treponema sp.]
MDINMISIGFDIKKAAVLVLSLLTVMISSWATSGGGEDKKIALVIGNAKYKGSLALSNPVNDAKDMQDKLRSIGFDVDCVTDADRKAMNESFKKFYSSITDADIALLYYSGHGMESGGENYLIPVQSEIKDATDLEIEAVSLNRVVNHSLDAVGSGGGNLIVILDACRNNPLAKTRGVSRGLAVIEASPVAGCIIAYSCRPGTVAADGSGRHSPFTEALLGHIDEQNVSFIEIMQTVRSEVQEATGNSQIPSFTIDTSDQLFLNGYKKSSPQRRTVNVNGKENRQSQFVYTLIICILSMMLLVVIVIFSVLTSSGRAAVSVVSKKVGEGVESGKKRAGEAVDYVRDKMSRPDTGGSAQNTRGDFSSSNSLLDTVCIGGKLLVGKTPVTLGQYRSVMSLDGDASSNASTIPVTWVDWYDSLVFLNALSVKENLDPVYSLSDRNNVTADLSKNGWRLPSQKEWKKAAGKAPSKTNIHDSAWYSDNSLGSIKACGQKEANAAGLYDMYGLVWEWCYDTLDGNFRVLKGGSWDSGEAWCSPKVIEAVVPSYKSDNTGFRAVRNV